MANWNILLINASKFYWNCQLLTVSLTKEDNYRFQAQESVYLLIFIMDACRSATFTIHQSNIVHTVLVKWSSSSISAKQNITGDE